MYTPVTSNNYVVAETTMMNKAQNGSLCYGSEILTCAACDLSTSAMVSGPKRSGINSTTSL
jgi:hypothetical protein